MRISDDRYSRDRQRYELAWRLISHKARTSTIVRWTGLSQYQVRRIFRDYGRGRGKRDIYRLRGIPPYVLAFFWRSQDLYHEAVVLAGLCRELGVFPTELLPDAERSFPSLERGERLCVAYEAFKAHFPESQISMEYAVLLVTGLAIGTEVSFGNCRHCTRLMVVDRYAAHPDHCTKCKSGVSPGIPDDERPAPESHERPLAPTSTEPASAPAATEWSVEEMQQQRLF